MNMGGARDSYCRKKKKSTNRHKYLWKHVARALVLQQGSCLEAVIHVLHNWNPQHKCVRGREREREKLRSVSTPLFWVPGEPLSADWLEHCVDKNQGTKRTFHQLYSLSPTTVVSSTLLLSFFPLLPFLLFEWFCQRAKPDCDSFLSRMLENCNRGVHLCPRCNCHRGKKNVQTVLKELFGTDYLATHGECQVNKKQHSWHWSGSAGLFFCEGVCEGNVVQTHKTKSLAANLQLAAANINTKAVNFQLASNACHDPTTRMFNWQY